MLDSDVPLAPHIRYNDLNINSKVKGPLEEEQQQLISLQEAAALSGMSATHLRHLAEKGRLPARKIGRNWITTGKAVAEYLANAELRSKDPYKYKRTKH